MKQKLGFILTIVIFFPNLALASLSSALNCSTASSQSEESGKANIEYLRTQKLNSLKSNSHLFCNNELAARFLISSKGKSFLKDYGLKKCEINNQKDLYSTWNILYQSRQRKSFSTPWLEALIPHHKFREDSAKLLELTFLKEELNLHQAYKSLVSNKLPPNALDRDIIGNRNTAINFDKKLNVNRSKARKYACQEIRGLIYAFTCDKPFEVIERVSSPSHHGISGIEIYQRIFADKKFEDGLVKAAIKTYDRYINGTPNTASFYLDIKSSFLDSGLSDTDAEEYTWETLAVIATSGPNMAFRMSMISHKKEQWKIEMGLTMMATLLPILDHRSAAKGFLYSFPREIKTSCNVAKPYHFWFAAYLARRAALESSNPAASAAATFQAQKFYQLAVRKSGKTMSESPLFSPASQIVRIDLAYAAAGAFYGANKSGDRKVNLDIDEAIIKLIEVAGKGSLGALGNIATKVGGNLAAVYKKWMNKFNPNAAFSFFSVQKTPSQINKRYQESFLKIDCNKEHSCAD